MNRRTATTAALALACAVTLAACGSDADSDAGSGDGAGDGTGGTRTVDSAMGPVEVPENPQRVVVLDTAELDTAITLGVIPVGAVQADATQEFLDYLPQDQLADIENVGGIAAPNLEAINDLDPDLIIGSKVRDEQRYDELSAIAPTVFTETVGAPWQENFLTHADALGRSAEAEEVVAAYQAHVAEVVEAIGGPEAAADIEVSMLRFIDGGNTRLYGRENYIGGILGDLGLGRPAIVDDAPDGFAVEISPEQVDQADGDVIYYASYGDPDASGEDAAVGGPLWEDLTAVQEGRAFPVNDQLWYLGIGYTAAEQILDEIEQTLVG
ncbi:iron-siderophore ABC transporter substrate-binding protein [Streptomyces sp. DSM 44915]|uniref:Iron-siderophore ABC transporter substrate-binding protein n=1 Tax=Streptomyces chisholmiae TaxID=3075540 RepID=A0ABU2JT27_9ACTN|nr:iron-siderophore ABC transporter substrate-binding protein [Streptomyces sp. DSM 44915]MDT0268137.1 iron-siderophore ABC transporter substrate-binding protein [Streptomyces sp. DSM 44915]